MDHRLVNRYWANVVIPTDPDACWSWALSTTKRGYPQLMLSEGKRKCRHVYVHRLAYELHHGVNPGSLFVCHACDNPICTNPRHLWLGTNGDNIRDARSKGRLDRVCKYSDDAISEYRAAFLANPRQWRALAQARGFHLDAAKRIIRGMGRFAGSDLAKAILPPVDSVLGVTMRSAMCEQYMWMTYKLMNATQLAQHFRLHPNTVRLKFIR